MDLETTKHIVEALQWVGAATAGGVIGNSADRHVQRLSEWLVGLGYTPENSWVEEEAALPIAEKLSSQLTVAQLEQFSALVGEAQKSAATSTAHVQHHVHVESENGTAIGQVNGNLRISNARRKK